MLNGVESAQRSEVAMYYSIAGMLVAALLQAAGSGLLRR
jgi:hypothetical protein